MASMAFVYYKRRYIMQSEAALGSNRYAIEPKSVQGQRGDSGVRGDLLLHDRIRTLEQTLSVLREDLHTLWCDAGQGAWMAALDDMSERLDDLGFYIDCREAQLPSSVMSKAKRPISAEQVKLLTLAARGLTSAEIAEQTGVPLSTIGARFVVLYRSLNVKSRGQAIAVALKNRWIRI